MGRREVMSEPYDMVNSRSSQQDLSHPSGDYQHLGRGEPVSRVAPLPAGQRGAGWDLAGVTALARKLDSLCELSSADQVALSEMPTRRGAAPAGADLVGKGERLDAVRMVVSGWACHYHTLDDGRRQISAFLLPGDFCNPPGGGGDQGLDHGVGALTRVTVADMPPAILASVAEAHPAVGQAMTLAARAEQAVLRRWVVNLGALSGGQRIAHLFCELAARLGSIGMVKAGAFEMPLTQAVLAETCGLSPVHMNRVLQHLRSENLIQLDRRRLTILDEPRLQAVAGFRADYLKLRTA